MVQTPDSLIAPTRSAAGAPSSDGVAWTRALLGCGVVAGPLYVAVALVQGLTRSGFDLSRDDVSLLANGALGWIQIGNFLLAGLLTLACAAGVQRVLGAGRAGAWGPWLLRGYGMGLIAAGIFRADPSLSFPPGTPAGRHPAVSWHAMLHIAFAGVGFLCLITACFVLAARFAEFGRHRWAAYSRITGAVFFVGFAAVASGSASRVVVLGFWVAVIAAWAWLALLAARLMPARTSH